MTTIGEAVALFGFPERAGQDIVVQHIMNAKPRNYLPAEFGKETTVDRDWYVSGGRFAPGTVTPYEGRTRENLLGVGLLSFDFDLAPFLDEEPATVYAMPTATLRTLAGTMRLQVERIAAEIGLTLHVIAYTGHGLLGVVRVGDHDPDALPTIVAAYKGIVDRINEVAGEDFADPAVSDAGTRLIRLPGTYNVKGTEPRMVEVWHDQPGTLSVVDLVAIGGGASSSPRVLTAQEPPEGELSPTLFTELVDLVRPHWKQPNRNGLAQGVPAAFVKAGVRESQADAFLEAMGPDEEMHNRRTNFARAYSRHARGMEITGYHKLREILPAEVLARFDAILDGVRQSQGVKLKVGSGGGGRRDRAESFRATPFPAEAWYPGWFTEYRDLVAPLTEAPPQYHLGAALAIVSATIGRKASLEFGGPLYPSLYCLLIGPSGSARKDTAIKFAQSLPGLLEASSPGTIAVPSFAIQTDISSAEALVSMLNETPTLLLKLSEINALLANAQRKGTRTLLDKLIEAFDVPPVLQIQSIRARSEKAAAAASPFLAIIAAAQPGRFGDMVTDEDIHSGFLNRWIVFPGIGGEARPYVGNLDSTAAAALYRRLKASVARYDGRRPLQLDAEAQSLNAEWYRRLRASMGRDEAEDAMRQRHQAIALKVALIYAVVDEADIVRADHLRAAIALVEWSWENVRTYMRLWGVSTTHKLERRILDVLEQTGPIRRRELQQKTHSRQWNAIEFGRVLTAMLANGTVGLDSEHRIGLPDVD